MTELARNLIEALRGDTHIREHFDMSTWVAECGTVGCIAGTALLMSDNWKNLRPEEVNYICHDNYGDLAPIMSANNPIGDLLGLPYPTARHLFLPDYWRQDLISNHYENQYKGLWAGNQTVDLSTIEKMKEFAHYVSFNNIGGMFDRIGPDEAAQALENCLEQPHYMDWARVLNHA